VRGAAACCIETRAAEGAVMHFGGKREIVASRSNTAIDVIGAGDAFLAGVVQRWIATEGLDPLDCAEAGARTAAEFIRKTIAKGKMRRR
jgi:sugar/nucleoside kinase (ribokinase family)